MSTGTIVCRTKRKSRALSTYESILQGFINQQEENELGKINKYIPNNTNKTLTKVKQTTVIEAGETTIYSEPVSKVTEAEKAVNIIKFIKSIQ